MFFSDYRLYYYYCSEESCDHFYPGTCTGAVNYYYLFIEKKTQPPTQQPMVAGKFHEGARFDKNTQPTIPVCMYNKSI